MGKLFLTNDVECITDADNVIVGNIDSVPTKVGARQCEQISQYLSIRYPEFDIILSSDSSRVTKLLHQIRLRCKVRSSRVRYSALLRERNFGVLNGTQYIYGLNSDLFRHSRICAEGGESVYQCAQRSIKYIKEHCKLKLRVLCVSHPFLCQIISNVLCNQKQTLLTSQWTKKGTLFICDFDNDIYEPISFHDMLELKDYSIQEIYADSGNIN